MNEILHDSAVRNARLSDCSENGLPWEDSGKMPLPL
jgi:hypothetical protein